MLYWQLTFMQNFILRGTGIWYDCYSLWQGRSGKVPNLAQHTSWTTPTSLTLRSRPRATGIHFLHRRRCGNLHAQLCPPSPVRRRQTVFPLARYLKLTKSVINCVVACNWYSWLVFNASTAAECGMRSRRSCCGLAVVLTCASCHLLTWRSQWV